jgi:hypothetical protein
MMQSGWRTKRGLAPTAASTAAMERKYREYMTKRVRLPGYIPLVNRQLIGPNYNRSNVSTNEVKCMDIAIAGGAAVLINNVVGTEPAAAYTGMTEINVVRQDGTVSGRVGNKIVIKSISIRFGLSTTVIAGAIASFRMLLIYDKQPNGAFPAIGDIIMDQPAALTTSLSSINIANKSRFQFIRDNFVTINAGGDQCRIVHTYAKGRWETEYGGNVGSIADFRTGSILLLIFYSFQVVGNCSINQMQSRIRYYD